jgi:antitoxin CptB
MAEDDRTRRKRLKYRSIYRGNKELDIIFGAFARKYLDDLDAVQLDRFETLLEADDLDIYNWLVGRTPIPPEYDHDVLAMLRDAHLS